MIRRTDISLLVLLALSLLTPRFLHAQSSAFDLLTGGSSKTWSSVSIIDNGNPVSVSHIVVYNSDGTVTAYEGEETITGRWALVDDSTMVATMIVTDRRSGEWHMSDTMRITIEELSSERMVLSSATELGSMRIEYASPAIDSAKKFDQGFEEFYARFRAAVKKNDKKMVASMTNFPFRSYDLVGILGKLDRDPSFTREEFLKYYGKLFDKRARRLIAVSTPTPLTDDDGEINRYAVGIRGGKNSTTWIEFWLDESGTWWLVGTDNVSYGE